MFKKYLSGMIAMSLSLALIPLNVMAEGELSIKSFNATKTAVIIDFDGIGDGACPDEETVRENIILEKHSADGKITRVTNYQLIVQENEMNGKDSKNKEAVLNKTNSVTIKPAEGILENAIYRITVKEGFLDTAGNTAAAETTEWFGIEVLFEDNFNADGHFDFVGKTADYPYYWDEKNGVSYLLTKYWTTTSSAQLHIGNITKNNDYKDYNVYRWCTNDVHTSITEEALPLDKRVSDYTIEYKYQYPGYANNGSHTCNIRAESATSAAGYNYNSGYRILLRNGVATASKTTAPVKFYVGSRIFATTDDYTPQDSLIDVRFSAIGDNIQYSIDDDKLIDLIDSTYTEAGTVGMMDKNNVQYWIPSYIDDFVMTRVINYGGEIPEISVESSSINGDTFLIEMSEVPMADNLSKLVELRGTDGKVGIDVSLDGKVISITPKETLTDGGYVLTLKEGLSASNSATLNNAYQIAFDVAGGVVTEKNFAKPEFADINVSILNEEFKMTYTYNGEGDNESKYIIYSSAEKDGEFKEIASGTLSDNELIMDADDKYIDKYIKVKIMPEDSFGYLNNTFETDVVKGMFTPGIKTVSIDDKFEDGSVKITEYEFYDENGDEDLTDIQWYMADSFDGEYEPIEGETGEELVIDDKLRDKFVKAYVTPKTNTYPYEGEVYKTGYYCRIYEPEAFNVAIIGESKIGNIVNCIYEYFDKNNTAESGSTARWLIADTIDGEYKAIGEEMLVSAGYSIDFNITEEHIGKYLKYEVTPRKEGKVGKTITSDAFVMPKKPEAKNVEISGTVKVGYTVSGSYEYYSENGAEQDECLFKWYVGDTVVSEEQNYTIKNSDAGKKLYFEVTPVSKEEPKIGETVKSEGILVTKKKTSSGGGGGGGSYSGVGAGTIVSNIQQNIEKVEEKPTTLITNFTDIDESVYKKEIVELYDKGMIKGVSETEFRPQREITRAEFVTLIVRILKLDLVEYEDVFTDIPENEWYTQNVLTANKNGLVDGYAGKFRPADGIKTEEILKILVQAYERDHEEIVYDEDSFKNVSDWAVIYANKAKKIGLIDDDKEFKLNEKALRDGAAALIYRFLEEVEQ